MKHTIRVRVHELKRFGRGKGEHACTWRVYLPTIIKYVQLILFSFFLIFPCFLFLRIVLQCTYSKLHFLILRIMFWIANIDKPSNHLERMESEMNNNVFHVSFTRDKWLWQIQECHHANIRENTYEFFYVYICKGNNLKVETTNLWALTQALYHCLWMKNMTTNSNWMFTRHW